MAQPEKLPSGRVVQAFDLQVIDGELRRRLTRVDPAGEYHDDPLRLETTGDETQHVQTGRVDPLDVIDQQERRPSLAGISDQGESPEGDEQRVRDGRVIADADGPEDGRTVSVWNVFGEVEDGRQELVERGERHVLLRLCARRRKHTQVAVSPHAGHRGQEGRLPHARVADDGQGRSPAIDGIEQCGDQVEFPFSPDMADIGRATRIAHRRRSHPSVSPVTSMLVRTSEPYSGSAVTSDAYGPVTGTVAGGPAAREPPPQSSVGGNPSVDGWDQGAT